MVALIQVSKSSGEPRGIHKAKALSAFSAQNSRNDRSLADKVTLVLNPTSAFSTRLCVAPRKISKGWATTATLNRGLYNQIRFLGFLIMLIV